MAGPVIDFQTCGRYCADDIYLGNAVYEITGRTVLVVPVIEILYRSGKKCVTDIAEYGGIFVKGWPHVFAAAGSGAVDVMLQHTNDGFVFTDINCIHSHAPNPLLGLYRAI